MGLDTRAIISQSIWLDIASDMPNRIASLGYVDDFSVAVSQGGITDSFNSDLLDSEGNIIFDSVGFSDPENPFGGNSVPSYGYLNALPAQFNARVITMGYLGVIATSLVWLEHLTTKSWIALNSKFKMR